MEKGYVDEAREHIVIVTTNSHRRGHKLRIAYEDNRLVSTSELHYELEQLELELAKNTPNEMDIDTLALDSSSCSDAPSSEDAEGTPSVEAALWSFHPKSRSFLANEGKARLDGPEFDIGTETPTENLHKEIGEYQSRLQTEMPLSLESCEHEILQQIRSVINDEEVSESKLHFARMEHRKDQGKGVGEL